MTRWVFLGETFAGCLDVGRALGAQLHAARSEPSGYGTSVLARKGMKGFSGKLNPFWKDSPIPYRKENLERFLHVLWQDITPERMSPLGPRGGLKAFCSRTVPLHIIAGFFQRAQADRARHGFQRESSTLKSQKRNQPGGRQGNAGNTILFDRAVH